MVDFKERSSWVDFINGSKEAFRSLYDSYIDRLHSYGKIYTTDEELIKDCIHDLFIELDRYRERLNPDVNIRSYMFISLRRKIFSELKTYQSHIALEEADIHLMPIEESNPEKKIIDFESETAIIAKLKYEVGNLTERQREAIYLKFNSEFSYDEIAQIMEVTVPTCRTLIYRAIKQLRKKLEGQPLGSIFWLLFHSN